MSKWYDEQQKFRSDFRKSLQERINTKRKRRGVLADEQQQRANGQ